MNKIFLLSIVLLLLAVSGFAQAIFDQSFEGSYPPYGWTNNGGTLRPSPAASGGFNPGSYSVYLTDPTQSIVTPKMASPFSLTVWAYQGGNGNCAPQFYSSDNLTGPWTLVSSFNNIPNGIWTVRTVTVSLSNKYLRISYTQGGRTQIYIDGITITPQFYDFTYRTVASGDWSNPLIWEYSRDGVIWYTANVPPSYDLAYSTIIRSGHTVSVGGNVNIDELTVETGAVVNVLSGANLNINNGTGTDLTMQGTATLNISGAISFSSGATSSASNQTSISMIGNNSQTIPSGFPSSIGNLTINNPAGVVLATNLQINGTLTMSSGVMTVTSGNLQYATGAKLVYNGSLSQATGDEWTSPINIEIRNENTSLSGLQLNRNKTLNNNAILVNNGHLVMGNFGISGSGQVTNNNTIIADGPSPIQTQAFNQTHGSTINYTTDVILPSPFVYQNLILSSSNQLYTLSGNITVNESFQTTSGARLNPAGNRVFFPFKYVSVGGFNDINSFNPETYVEAPAPEGAVARKWTFIGSSSGVTTMYLHWDNEQGSAINFSRGASILRYNGTEWTKLANVAAPVADGPSRMMVSFQIDLGAKGDEPGQYAVTGNDETLPVELSSFTAVVGAQNVVSLQWITQSETNVSGYQIYRSNTPDIENALLVSNLITAVNSSQTQVYLFRDQQLQDPGTFYYWLQNLDFDGSTGYHGPITVQVNPIEGNTPPTVLSCGIKSIYPNPFNPRTTIRYSLTERANVRLDFYNLRGQLLQSVNKGSLEAGVYTYDWDAQDSRGTALPSGVYRLIIQIGQRSYSQKLVLLK